MPGGKGRKVGTLAYAGDASERARIAAVLVVAVVLVASVIGGAMTFTGSRAAPGTTTQQSSGNQVGDAVETSFGSVSVEFVRQVDGVTDRALNGSTHGVNGLVNAGHAKIQATVAITNDIDNGVAFSSDQFRLRVSRKGKTTYQDVNGGDLPDSRVMPGSGITGHLDFTVTRDNARLVLEFTDHGRAVPIVISLGRTSFGPRAPADHAH